MAKGLDQTDSFSWSQVGVGALTAAVGAGVGSVAKGSELLSQAYVRGAISSVSSYGANVIMGEEAHFSWTNVAAAAVSAQIGQSLTGAEPEIRGRSK